MTDPERDAAVEQDLADQPGSELIEAVALRRGLEVRRLTAELILCASAARRVAFRGLAGGKLGAVARVLCRHRSALMSHLAARGIPVAEPALAAADQLIHLAVVDGRVVVADLTTAWDGHQLPDPLETVAVRTIAAVPGAGYGTVSLVVNDAADRGRVYQVDPMLRRWPASAHHGGVTVAEAVLDLELGAPARADGR